MFSGAKNANNPMCLDLSRVPYKSEIFCHCLFVKFVNLKFKTPY